MKLSQILFSAFISTSFLSNAQNINELPITGVNADNEGVFAWNEIGNKEGHEIPAPYDAFGNDTAYYFLATREKDNFDPSSTTGMHGVGSFVGFPTFSAALQSNGNAIGDIKISIDGAGLGGDVQGTDWDLVGAVETRDYAGGHFFILLNADTLLKGELGDISLAINYNSEFTPFDDQISGNTDYAVPVNAATGATNNTIANAFLADIGVYGVRFSFTTMQHAGQTEYRSGNIYGGFYEVQSAKIESGTVTLPVWSNLNACSGDSVLLDAGPGKTSYLWNTGATTQTIYAKTTGTYYVSIDSSGVKARSANADVVISPCTGIAENSNSKMKIFPVPVKNQLSVQLDNLASIKQIQIVNLLGKTVLSENQNGTIVKVSTSSLVSGVYFVKVMESNGTVNVQRFIKK